MPAAEKLASLRNAHMGSAVVFMDCVGHYEIARHRPEIPNARFKGEILSTNWQTTGFRSSGSE